MKIEQVTLDAYHGTRTHFVTHEYHGLLYPLRWHDLLTTLQDVVKYIRPRRGDYILGLDGPGMIPACALAQITDLPVLFATKTNLSTSPKIHFLEPASPRPDIYIYGLRPGMSVIVVDDGIETGRTMASCLTALAEERITIRSVLVILESRAHGARERIRELGHKLISIREHDGT